MKRTLLLLAISATLGACQHAGGSIYSDYCHDSHPVNLRHLPEWKSSYSMCRMMDASIKYGQRPAIDVYIRN